MVDSDPDAGDRVHAGDDLDEPELEDVVNDTDDVASIDATIDQLAVGPSDSQTDTHDYPPEELNNAACRFCRESFESVTEERGHLCEERRSHDHLSDLEDGLVQPQMHEVGAQWLFDNHGLDPYFAIVSNFDHCLQNPDGTDDVGTFDAAGNTWRLNHDENKVKYWEGKIATRPGDSGDAYYEYNIGVVADDAVGRRRANFQFRPALPHAEHVDTGEEIGSLPSDLPEGVRVQIDGANVALEDYIDVLQGLMDAMGVNPDYFKEYQLHEWSRCYNQAPYVRIDRQLSEARIVSKNGLLERLSQHASNQRGAGRREWDNREIKGHRNTVAMDAQNIEAFLPQQTVGKLLKSYHMKNPEKQADNATANPKLEVQYSTEFSFGDFESVPWHSTDAFDAYDLRDELTEWLLNVLDWAGITLAPTDDVYVQDEYFQLDALEDVADRAIDLYPDPMPALEEKKIELAEHHILGNDLTKTDMEILQALTDGGEYHHEDLAEETGTSSSSVYRLAEKIGDIIRQSQGVFELADEVIRDRLGDLFQCLKRTADWVDDSIAKVAQDAKDVELAQDSPLAKWMRTYGVSLQREGYGHDSWTFDIQVGRYALDEIRRVLRSGYHAARATGAQISDRFLEATFSWHTKDGERETREKAFTITPPVLRALGMPVTDVG